MAKAFKFPLQKILDIRKSLEERKAIELSQAKTELKRQQEKLENLNRIKQEALKTAIEKQVETKNLTVNDLKLNSDYVDQISQQINGQLKNVDKTESEVEKKREDLLTAAREKKAVEKLKEKKLDSYRRKKTKKDNKLESELAIRISKKNNGERE